LYPKSITATNKSGEECKDTKMFTKPKSLIEQLMAMAIGEEEEIKRRVFKTTSIRVAVTNLRKRGYDFIVTEKGILDGCRVTRIR